MTDDKMIAMRHKLTGIVAEFPARYLDHPVLGQNLEAVDEDAYCTDCTVPTAPSAVDLDDEVAFEHDHGLDLDDEPVTATADEPVAYDEKPVDVKPSFFDRAKK